MRDKLIKEILAEIGTEYEINELSRVECLDGMLSALRVILRCGSGNSILRRAITVMRRYDDLVKTLPIDTQIYWAKQEGQYDDPNVHVIEMDSLGNITKDSAEDEDESEKWKK